MKLIIGGITAALLAIGLIACGPIGGARSNGPDWYREGYDFANAVAAHGGYIPGQAPGDFCSAAHLAAGSGNQWTTPFSADDNTQVPMHLPPSSDANWNRDSDRWEAGCTAAATNNPDE